LSSASGVDPDAGLLGFRRVSEELGTSPWYLRMLRDSNTEVTMGSLGVAVAQRLEAVSDLVLVQLDALEGGVGDRGQQPRSWP
jgi:hypothetical protein